MTAKRRSLGKKLTTQGIGKVRRFVHLTFRRKAVKDGLSRRRGKCRCCGECCRLVMRCPMLGRHRNGTHFCRIYKTRPPACRYFPLDERCLAERDLNASGVSCGYHFVKEPESPPPKKHRT